MSPDHLKMCPLFLMQGAADPGYPNKYSCTHLMQLSIYLCSFSSTCFGLIRPSSGAMDVTISLHMRHMVSLV